MTSTATLEVKIDVGSVSADVKSKLYAGVTKIVDKNQVFRELRKRTDQDATLLQSLRDMLSLLKTGYAYKRSKEMTFCIDNTWLRLNFIEQLDTKRSTPEWKKAYHVLPLSKAVGGGVKTFVFKSSSSDGDDGTSEGGVGTWKERRSAWLSQGCIGKTEDSPLYISKEGKMLMMHDAPEGKDGVIGKAFIPRPVPTGMQTPSIESYSLGEDTWVDRTFKIQRAFHLKLGQLIEFLNLDRIFKKVKECTDAKPELLPILRRMNNPIFRKKPNPASKLDRRGGPGVITAVAISFGKVGIIREAESKYYNATYGCRSITIGVEIILQLPDLKQFLASYYPIAPVPLFH
jgi:hypothetical protein